MGSLPQSIALCLRWRNKIALKARGHAVAITVLPGPTFFMPTAVSLVLH